MNKKKVFYGLVIFGLLAFTSVSELNWVFNFEDAKTEAKSNSKVILMSFSGSDWCGNCIRLDKTVYQTEEFTKFAASKLVSLQLDFPAKKKNKLSEEQTAHNEKLAEQFNPKGAFPKAILLDAEGNILGNLPTNVASPEAFISEINKIISSQ